MAHSFLDISRLPKDVLTYRNERFFDFIENFCGKDEADLLAVQAIRTVDSFMSIKDVYSIFSLDSADLIDIQTRCGFKNKNGSFTVKPGIKSSLDHVTTLLQKMTTIMLKNKKSSTTSSLISTNSSNSVDLSNDNNVTIASTAKKTEMEHYEFITTSIDQWCIQSKNIIDLRNYNPVCGVGYHLKFNPSLDKVEILCSCGSKCNLFLGEAGNFKVSNYFRHLKASCLKIKRQPIGNSVDDEPTRNATAVSLDISLSTSSQHTSTKRNLKRNRQTTSNNAKKKVRIV